MVNATLCRLTFGPLEVEAYNYKLLAEENCFGYKVCCASALLFRAGEYDGFMHKHCFVNFPNAQKV